MKILNIGCGTKVCNEEEVINIDWSPYLKLHKNRITRKIAPLYLRGQRRERFLAIEDNILVHNLSKGIPFSSNSIDVVYHSHFLEHLDSDCARNFLVEAHRVLIPGGIHRIVVPDLEKLAISYLSHLELCIENPSEANTHISYIASIFEQFVRNEAFSTSKQPAIKRVIENLLLGDARRRGETHQWMYDRVSLNFLLRNLGYQTPRIQRYDTSQIERWDDYRLDMDNSGNEYKPGSLYMETIK